MGSRYERGQTTVLMAVVVSLIFGLAFALVVMGGAVVSRARARTAADAIALAAVVDPHAAAELGNWYRETGAAVEVDPDRAWVGIDSSQAAAWAEAQIGEVHVAPAVVAIVERAGQLIGHRFAPIKLQGTSAWFNPTEAALFASVSMELGMCATSEPDGVDQFVLCDQVSRGAGRAQRLTGWLRD